MLLFGIRFEQKRLAQTSIEAREPVGRFLQKRSVSDDFMTEREQPPAEDRDGHTEATE